MRLRPLLVLVLLLVSVLAAPTLSAQPARGQPRRVVVEQFQGVAPLVVRPGAVQALDGHPGLKVVTVKVLGRVGKVAGGTPESYAEAARKLGLSAFVSGETTQVGPGRYAARLVVRDANGQVIGEYTYEGRWVYGVRTEIIKRFWADVRPVFDGQAQPAPKAASPAASAAPAPEHIVLEEEPEPAAERATTKPQSEEPKATVPAGSKPEARQPESPESPEAARAKPEESLPPPSTSSKRKSGRGSRWPSALEFELGGGATFRDYVYKTEYLGPLREYHLLRAPFGTATLTWFPGAAATPKAGAHIGITGSIDQMFPIDSRVSGQKLSTRAGSYSGGIVGRIPASWLELRPSLVYGVQEFKVERDYVPDTDYRFVRPGLALRLGLFHWRWSWTASGGFRWLISTGQIESAAWFPGARGLGWDGGLETAVRLFPWFELGARGRYRQNRIALHPVAGGAYANGVAETAVDRSSDVSLFLRLLVSRRR